MHLELIAYPFIFAAIYFEAFLLVTFLSKPARTLRERPASVKTPKVAMIVPCWNEETTVKGTADSLLALEYPKEALHIYLVDDGSTDGTAAVMDAYAGNPQITVIHQENAGKHSAINKGIALATDAEFIGCLDADSFVEPGALREIISCFDNPKVAAATPGMSVHAPKRFIERIQHAEFVLGIALRHILSSVNGLHVTPGPFSLYRRDVVVALGGFKYGHQTEDMEMALRIQRAGYVIDSAPRARVYTKVPKSVPKLIKQRTRWTAGFLRNVSFDYRDLVGNRHHGALGLLVLPLGFAAIFGGIIIFFAAIYQLITEGVRTYSISNDVPLLYTLSPHISFEWFYFPVTTLLVFSVIAMTGSIVLMILGKRISATPTSLGIGMVGYLLLYGLIAPLWLIRSVADVASGTKGTWR